MRKDRLKSLLTKFASPAMRMADFDEERLALFQGRLFPAMADACHVHGVAVPPWLVPYDRAAQSRVVYVRNGQA